MTEQKRNDLGTAKATMVLINSIGYPVARQINVSSAMLDDQRKIGSITGLTHGAATLTVYYAEKGKRKVGGTRFASNRDTIAIFAGWHDIEIPTVIDACDYGLYNNMKAQIAQTPIIEFNEKRN